MTTPILGSDASKGQGANGMSFQRFDDLHAAGVRFGVFRATIGTVADASYPVNARRAAKLGWAVGGYHFLYPGDGRGQADAFSGALLDGIDR